MRTISLPKSLVLAAASDRDMTPSEIVSRLLAAAFGSRVCSHLDCESNSAMIFSIDSVSTPDREAVSNERN